MIGRCGEPVVLPPSRDPETLVEWQDAVDAAHFALLIDSARQYGLITGGDNYDVARCAWIIERGAQFGVTPTPPDPDPPRRAGRRCR